MFHPNTKALLRCGSEKENFAEPKNKNGENKKALLAKISVMCMIGNVGINKIHYGSANTTHIRLLFSQKIVYNLPKESHDYEAIK